MIPRLQLPIHLQRRSLWVLLVLLVLALLATLVWLAGRYEVSQVQSRLERDANAALSDVRGGLTRNVQSLQALHFNQPTPGSWVPRAAELLRQHREMLQLEWRDPRLAVLAQADTPYRQAPFSRLGRERVQADVALACATANRQNGAAYGGTYFLPLMDGLGLEVTDLCLPLVVRGQVTGYLVVTYALQGILAELIDARLSRNIAVSFTEADGIRLALHGLATRGDRTFTAQQLLDLPGLAMVLRLDSASNVPDLFPNVLTALVAAMSLALVVVLYLLASDMRRRLTAERDLAEALAFRKAMEDSLVTGLRARDLQGRITYVNPAFCGMVGFAAAELLGSTAPAPYWPTEQVDEYQRRHAVRMAGHSPPREGFESVFMRKDGTRFPVLIIEAPLINAVGTQTGWMSACLDISEQRRVEELSRTSQERLQATARLAMVGEMASLLSHELNQPLAAISSYATGSLNLLQQDNTDGRSPGGVDVALRRIGEQAERAGKVIKSVHDFVRRRDQTREAVAPQALINAVMPLVTLQARKLGVQVVTHCTPDLPPVLCDRTMVEQVLLNLARNGMQAMVAPTLRRGADPNFASVPDLDPLPQANLGSDPQVTSLPAPRVLTISVRLLDGDDRQAWLEFSVSDLGPGIPDHVAQQLFTPFFTTKAEGMGLGLSLCRTVVEQHGGRLSHAALQPRGTVFTFTLSSA